jgi:hypothetical protein
MFGKEKREWSYSSSVLNKLSTSTSMACTAHQQVSVVAATVAEFDVLWFLRSGG